MEEHNCPNCGAVVHDCICDYCGTGAQGRERGGRMRRVLSEEARRRFGDNLRVMMAKRGMSQHALAAAAGMFSPSVNRYVAGKTEPSLGGLLKLCHALECEPNDLLEGVAE